MYIKSMDSEFHLTRTEIQEKIQSITQTIKDHASVKVVIEQWLAKNKCSDFEKKQILNDLTSYKEYLELMN